MQTGFAGYCYKIGRERGLTHLGFKKAASKLNGQVLGMAEKEQAKQGLVL